MEIRDVNTTFLTLHMGLGHFRKVDVEDLSKHKMDSEQMVITEETANLINATKAAGNKVFAVGITVNRALETPVTTKGEVKPYDLARYEIVDLLSNAHRVEFMQKVKGELYNKALERGRIIYY